MERRYTLTFQPSGKRIEVAGNATVAEGARLAGVGLRAECAGAGACGKCLVLVSPDRPGSREPPAHRLACRHAVTEDLIVEVPETSFDRQPKSGLVEEGEGNGPRAADPDHRLGLAVDLGSTKIAAYLLDLDTGEELARLGAMNPQLAYGENVISRLAHALKGEAKRRELTSLARNAVADLASNLLALTGGRARQLTEACVVGNTAMIQLLLAQPVERLAKAPYTPETLLPQDFDAGAIDLPGAPGARLHIPAAIGGFVGPDHTAMILSSRLHLGKKPALGVDIGTNTEIVLNHPGGGVRLSAACASGPAFEGAHIRDGMRAAPGAIDRVRFAGGEYRIATVACAPPAGICGSGLVDAVAALLDGGALDRRGHLIGGAPGVAGGAGGRKLVLAGAGASATGREIALTQADLVELQLAKGAIRGGIETLIGEAGVDRDEIATVVLAGAFGSRLNPASAVRIGLLPPLANARLLQRGNAAGEGARMMLLSRGARRRAAALARGTVYVDLATSASFKANYARALRFG